MQPATSNKVFPEHGRFNLQQAFGLDFFFIFKKTSADDSQEIFMLFILFHFASVVCCKLCVLTKHRTLFRCRILSEQQKPLRDSKKSPVTYRVS